uniref:Protein kinase domain-containing protein n=1 Tax=Setaria italica TaxID=4555 RepID=K3YGG2_SETIT
MGGDVGSSVGVVALAAAIATLLLPPFAAAAATGPGSSCTRSCGNITIPYPFGVEPGCYHAGFNLTCRSGAGGQGSPQLFLGDGTVQVLEISVQHNTVRINSTGMILPFNDGGRTKNGTWGSGLPRSGPYFLSETINRLLVLGCNTQVTILGGDDNNLVSSCTAFCPLSEPNPGFTIGTVASNCTGDSGINCCQASIVLSYSFYNIEINRLKGGLPFTQSIYIVDRSLDYTPDMVFSPDHSPKALPATLDWIIAKNSTCPTNTSVPECRSNHSRCQTSHSGYGCQCSDGYQGNPYVPDGCQDINECKSPDIYVCYGDCKNTPGSFMCQCPTGYTGNASIPNGCRGLSIGLGVGGTGLLLLALGGPFIIRKIKLQKVKKMRHKFFKENHGLLLQQLISRDTDIGHRMIITLRDLEKATDNFDRARIVGGGGHGVVFKGILDLQVVAIKKSKIVVQREINEFINEVAVLSQVNHRNVVKLLGCCLETEVPLLVYEFISNGSLYNHLHVEGPISLSWNDRMRIAMEVSKALSYLHSSASMPIFHRDVKSSNILLNDALTAKVSDFGASRYIPIDQTGVVTAVQGTFGYLDPMYYYTGRLTDKSDVFSFGVVLVELLTRKKPNDYQSVDGGSLVSHFVSLLAEDKLVDIVDPQEVATLAAMCTKLKGEDRPTMREVEMALENLLVKKKQVDRENHTWDGQGGVSRWTRSQEQAPGVLVLLCDKVKSPPPAGS